MNREKGIARCGLACCLCTEDCGGCGADDCPDRSWCENRACSLKKGVAHCFECGEDCKKGMLRKTKPAAFTLFCQRYGEAALLDALERNEKNGVVYHREGVTGDYDAFPNAEEVIRFLLTGER